MELTKTSIKNGLYKGVLRGLDPDAEAPQISGLLDGRALGQATLEPSSGDAGSWAVTLPLPADLLSEGLQVLVLTEAETGEVLDTVTVLTGQPLEQDALAELALLRAELDLLKKAFRRHSVEQHDVGSAFDPAGPQR